MPLAIFKAFLGFLKWSFGVSSDHFNPNSNKFNYKLVIGLTVTALVLTMGGMAVVRTAFLAKRIIKAEHELQQAKQSLERCAITEEAFKLVCTDRYKLLDGRMKK
jgi:hypothetical protein